MKGQRHLDFGRRAGEGFTLIELLIVVAIIAILAAIAVPNFLEAQTRSKVSRVKADMRTLATALEAYHVDENEYVRVEQPPGNEAWEIAWLPRLIPLTTPLAYITSIPDDVFVHKTNGGQVLDVANDPLFQCYVYCRSDMRIINPFSSPDIGKSFWSLQSSGPDNNVESDSYWTPEQISGFEQPGVAIPLVSPARYDPTNGTLSQGDIYRFSTVTHEQMQ